MNESQLKTRLSLMRSIDWILYFAVMSFGIYAFLIAETRLMPALITILGLLLVHWVGNFTFEKSAEMRVKLDILKRQRNK